MTEKLFADPAGDAVEENLKRIREVMSEACAAAGRREEEVSLLAVTKTVEPARINRAIALGVRQIGENRVQEFLSKREFLHLDSPSGRIGMHLIGHLQTNKVRQIVGLADMIESVDSVRVARAIDEASEKIGRVTDILIEVNIGGEESKTGIRPDELEPLLEEVSSLRCIRVRGLMTVPPILHTESEKRRVFSEMRELFIDIQGKNIDNIHMDVLSMGMSSDYREAILEGATIIRVGSALFGKRTY